MSLSVFNTLTGKKEPFEPIAAGHVGMYVCGVTVYDECHLGHARCYVVFDTIRRYLEYCGFAVNYVQNFTDVDDKIIARARERQMDPIELARFYESRYFDVFDKLNVRRADKYPRATEEIGGMIAMIRVLIDKGLAYVADGDVYFSTKSFPGYGKLSRRPEEALLAGARVEISEKKRDPLDFALWKKAKPGEPFWPSPWGDGRPGWHIECSAMAQKYVGVTLDIHGGGQDLIFPHHENEIAQSEGASGKPFARFFLHNGFVTVDGEKMSKSLGNFRTLEELYKEISPDVLRFFILSAHYRTPLTFTGQKLQDAAAGLARFREGFRHLQDLRLLPDGPDDLPGEVASFEIHRRRFDESMDNDFNTVESLGGLFKLFTDINLMYSKYSKSGSIPKLLKEELTRLSDWVHRIAKDVLGLDLHSGSAGIEDAQVASLLNEREKARKDKRYKDADRIRAEIDALGYQIQDTPQGPRAIRK